MCSKKNKHTLIIDQGNTAIKIAVFSADIQIFYQKLLNESFEDVVLKLLKQYNIEYCVIASVVENAQKRFDFVCKKISKTIFVSNRTPMPFRNDYATPLTLGVDRLALVAAAVTRYPNTNVLVIDAGTCITFDLVTEQKVYLGGAIAPGIGMRLEALHHFTSKLPLIAEQDFDPTHFVGNTTQGCILSGVYHNVICEIEGVIAQYKAQFKNLTVVLTGGNHLYLAKNIKSRIFAHPFFLFEGLYAILQHQNKL